LDGVRFFRSPDSAGGRPEKICGFDPKSPSEPVHHVDAGGVKVSFKRADIGTVDFGTVRQLFLRKAACPSKLPQIEREYLSYLHAREGSALKSISPRSILYKRA
jgi:hypothetical protein